MNNNLLTRNLIRLVIFVASLVFFVNMMSAQKVYVTDNPYNADYICYVTGDVFTADWVIYQTNNQYEAEDGHWFITDTRWDADFVICFPVTISCRSNHTSLLIPLSIKFSYEFIACVKYGVGC